MDEFLTIEEMSHRLKVKKSWLYRRTMEKGRDAIPCLRIGKYLRFREADVMAWIQKNQERG